MSVHVAEGEGSAVCEKQLEIGREFELRSVGFVSLSSSSPGAGAAAAPDTPRLPAGSTALRPPPLSLLSEQRDEVPDDWQEV